MNDKQIIEEIIRNIAASFSGEQSTKDWTDETIWFDASPYACVGKEKASKSLFIAIQTNKKTSSARW